MATTGVGFRWLDILEKEFDKACVELDTSLLDLEAEEGDMTFGARQKIATLSSCFAQLTHKALTIFQHSAKLEAELVDMRADLVQARAASAGGCQESGDAAGNVPEAARARAEAAQLARENAALRDTVLALHSELYGARLATKYLDKELAGRIQQLQLLGRDMRAELRDSLWAQVEAEILLQRHKTLVRVCRGVSPRPPRPPPVPRSRPRTVRVRRSPHLGLGISVTGGREHGVPILISELEAGGPAALTGDLYVGDAILAINDLDLSQACHKEAVQALQSVKGDCALCVQFIATDDDDRLSEDNYRFPLYPEDGSAFGEEQDGSGATPTAPRTPDYNNRPPSEAGSGSGSESRYHVSNDIAHAANITSMSHAPNKGHPTNPDHTTNHDHTIAMGYANNMGHTTNLDHSITVGHVNSMGRTASMKINDMVNMNSVEKVSYLEYGNGNSFNNNLDILDMDDDSIKIEARLEMVRPETSPRRRGAYRALAPLAALSAAPRSPPSPVSRAASSGSPHSTPVHQRRLSLKKKRKPQDWRTKGAYRALAPDALSSDEPLGNHDAHAADALLDEVTANRETYPAIVSDSLLESSPPPHAESAAPLTPSPPSLTGVTPSPVPEPTFTSPEQELAPCNLPATPPPEAPPLPALPPPPSAPLVDIESKSCKPNGESKPLLRRESKGFRIGTARRVVESAALLNGERRPPRASHPTLPSAPHPPRPPRLLPGHGDPDFGTPV